MLQVSGLKPNTKTSKLLFYIWGFLLPSDSGPCIWISRQLRNDLNPIHTGGVDEPSLWCFPTALLKSNVSICPHWREGGQDVVAPSWQRLLPLWLKAAARCCVPSFNSPPPCAWAALMLYFLLGVTDFYMAWMPVVPVNSLDHEAWRLTVYCSQGFFDFSNLELK